MPALVEVCVDRLDSVRACAAAGIDRIELCAALSEGGLTPSVGFLQAARAIFPGKIMLMIRPRAGDFLYSAGEIEIMLQDIALGKKYGADGFVFGCLNENGEIDAILTARLFAVAAPHSVTFHRAFDLTPDPFASLETLIALGIPRVLTSGAAADVWQGIGTLRALIQQASERIVILPGGGITADRAQELIAATGARELHLSARKNALSRMKFPCHDIPMGATAITPDTHHKIADHDALQMLRQQLNALP